MMFFGLNKTFVVINYCFVAVILTYGAVILMFFIENK